MRHLCNIGTDRIARDILTESNVQLTLCIPVNRSFDNLPERNGSPVLVRNFNSDCRLIRNGSFNTNTRSRKRKCNIVGKTCDPADLDTCRRLKLISCNGRASANIDNLCRNAEAVEGVNKLCRIIFKLLLVVHCACIVCIFKAVNGRLLIGVENLNRLFLFGGFCFFFAFRLRLVLFFGRAVDLFDYFIKRKLRLNRLAFGIGRRNYKGLRLFGLRSCVLLFRIADKLVNIHLVRLGAVGLGTDIDGNIFLSLSDKIVGILSVGIAVDCFKALLLFLLCGVYPVLNENINTEQRAARDKHNRCDQ